MVRELYYLTLTLVCVSSLVGYRFYRAPGWHYEVSGRHGLSAPEVRLVQRAVLTGRRLDEPRLRAATADWARTVLDDRATARREHRLQWRLHRVLQVGVAVLALAGLVLAVGERGHSDVAVEIWFALIAAGLLTAPWLRGRNQARIRRAVELNAEPARPGS